MTTAAPALVSVQPVEVITNAYRGSAFLTAHVVNVGRSATHTFSKRAERAITLVAGLGVDGDAHSGVTVKHRSRVAHDPSQPNLRQVHLIDSELFSELAAKGFNVSPGDLGENITTREIDLLALPLNAELHIGETAIVRVTGLRNPCAQLNRFQPDLMAAVLDHAPDGTLIRKAGIMGIVIASGEVYPRDAINVQLPPFPHRALERV